MNRTIRNRRPSAFTILELLIVIGILLAIGALVVINVMGSRDKADRQLTVVQMRQFQEAINRFKVDMRRIPTQEEGLKVLWSSEGLEEGDKAKWTSYLTEPKPIDTWGSAWIYKAPADIEGMEFDIISAGPDREEGNEDDISLARDRAERAGGEDAFSDFKSPDTGVSGGGSGGE